MANQRILRLLKIITGFNSGGSKSYVPAEGRLEHAVHFLMLIFGSFSRNRCFARASALSYATLLAIIPLLAVALSFTSIFLKEQDEAKLNQGIEQFVASIMPATAPTTNSPAQLPEASNRAEATHELSGTTNLAELASSADTNGAAVASAPNNTPIVSTQREIARQIEHFVRNSSSGALGVTGMFFFVVTSISLLRGIEETLNDLWGVTRGRSWYFQIILYSAVITWGPVLMVVVLGLTGGGYFEEVRALLIQLPFLAAIYSQVLPIALICAALTLFYKVTPNTKVNFSAALLGGCFAGIAWHVYNELGFLLASRLNNANKIYGSLALLVLLMGGLYIVWVILLLGAQIAYAFQNRVAYLQDKLADNVNQRGREFVALRLMTFIGQRFQLALPPATILEISEELRIPSRLTQQVLETLLGAQLVVEAHGLENAYSPARPLLAINAWHILTAMRRFGGEEVCFDNETIRRNVFGEFARIEEAERQAASSVTLITLLNQPSLPLALAPAATVLTPVKATTPELPSELSKAVPPTETKMAEETKEVILPVESRPTDELERTVKPISKQGTTIAQPREDHDFPL
jgi:membrane protein